MCSRLRWHSSPRPSAQAQRSASCWSEGYAGWHTSKELVVRQAHPFALLAALFARTAADVERLWPLSNEGVANQSFRTLDELEAAQIQRCVVLQNQPEIIRSYTHFHWWPPSHSKHQ
jgi:hypothetical protein